MKTKKTIITTTAAALMSVALASTSHAWFFRTNVDVNASKTYNTTAGRDVGSRNQTNSNNRYGSHDIKGDAKNANFGSINTSASGGRNFSGGNSFGSGRTGIGSNHTNLSGFGQNNQGNIGSGMNYVEGGRGGSVTMGDTNIIGDSAIKAANGQ